MRISLNLYKNKRHIVFLICFLLCLYFNIWKAPYGFCFSDEPYIISTAHRLLFGDALLVDEWFPAQLVGFLLYPLVYIYHMIMGSTEGIILCFRYCFVGLWTIVSLFSYYRLRSYPLAGFAVLSFYLFAPLDFMSLSYNSIALASLLTACIIFVTFRTKYAFAVSGVLLAAAILCCPLLLFVYLIYSFATFYAKHLLGNSTILDTKNWLSVTAGAAFMAALFFFFLFSRGSLQEILSSLKWIMTNTEHSSSGNIFIILYEYLSYIFTNFPYMFVLGYCAIIISILDRGRKKRQAFYISLILAGLVISLRYCSIDFVAKFNYIMVPFAFLGLQCFILTRKKDWTFFIIMYGSGILYSIFVCAMSNLRITAIGQGLSLATFSSFILVGQWIKETVSEMKEKQSQKEKAGLLRIRQILPYSLILACILQLGCQFYIRKERNYHDSTTRHLPVTLSEGPCAGLKTNSYNANIYNTAIDEIKLMDIPSDQNIFINTTMPWAYLAADREYSAFSSWFSNADEITKKQLVYWQMKPHKLPDNAYLVKDRSMGLEILSDVINLDDYTITETEQAWIIRKNL